MCGNFKFQNDAPMLNCCQKSLNSCCFGSLYSAFFSIKKINNSNAIPLHIEESLKIKVVNRIDFSNATLKNEKNSRQTKSVL